MGGCHVKLTKEQRLEIGRRIYNNEITKFEAAEKYGISVTTARDYMRMYRDANHLPPKKTSQHAQGSPEEKQPCQQPQNLQGLKKYSP